MFTLIENGDVYGPEPLGRVSILLNGNTILKIGERGNGFYVLGSGAVYVIDGSEVTYSNIAEENLNKTLSIYDVRMHMLS